MKKLIYNVAFLAVLSLTSFSCSDKEVEARIARLEGRIAELESKTGNSRSATPAFDTSNQTISSVVDEVPSGPLPSFKFDEETYDFGTISEGTVAEHTFKFTNVGEAPLIISSATASCGCTVPSYPKEPIPVGGKGEIQVKFDSQGKPGIQNKTVTITANTAEKISRLNIKSSVSPAAGGTGPVK
jgi:hypothetical protein